MTQNRKRGVAQDTDGSVAAPRRAPEIEGDLTIRRRSLHGSVADHLRAMIVQGELAPGQKVPMDALARSLGVSITPLREALKVLAEEQLVALTPNRGARVLSFTADEAAALFEVIAALEGLAAERAATRISAEHLEILEGLHFAMLSRFEAAEKTAYFDLNSQIHQQILKAAGNPVLIASHATLQMRAARGRYIAIIDQARWNEAMSEHEDIMSCLRERDPKRAAEVWRLHLLRTGAAVRRAQAEAAEREVHIGSGR